MVLASLYGVRGRSPNNKESQTLKAVWGHFLSPLGLAQATGRVGSDLWLPASQRPLRASILHDLCLPITHLCLLYYLIVFQSVGVRVGNRLSKTVEVLVLLWCPFTTLTQKFTEEPSSWALCYFLQFSLLFSFSPQACSLPFCINATLFLNNPPSPLQSPNAIFSFTTQMIVSTNQLFPFSCLSWTRARVFYFHNPYNFFWAMFG